LEHIGKIKNLIKINRYDMEDFKYYNSKEYYRKHQKEYYRKNKKKMKIYNREYRKRPVIFDTYAPQISYAEQVRKNKSDILEVKCAYCGKWFIPTLHEIISRIKALEGIFTGEHRLYCSDNCKQECPIFHKKEWPKNHKPTTSREVQPELRQMRFEFDNYTCQRCNKHQDELEVGLHCHHIEGIRWEPLESADLDMVITFCKICHKKVHKLPDCGYHDLRCEKLEDL
jgi:5-methylcytosine-specific restriction endonuclease McrA